MSTLPADLGPEPDGPVATLRRGPTRAGRPPWRRPGGWAVALVALAVLILSLVADPAPTRLAAVDPPDNGVLGAAPDRVSARFDGRFDPVEFHLGVAPDGGGRSTVTGPVRQEGRSIVLPVSLTPGTYRVGYHVRLADGQELTGFSSFTVTGSGVVAAPPPAAPVADDAPPGHVHGGDDPMSFGLLLVDLVLLAALAYALLRRPRPRPRPRP